jgi:hypothetical protein
MVSKNRQGSFFFFWIIAIAVQSTNQLILHVEKSKDLEDARRPSQNIPQVTQAQLMMKTNTYEEMCLIIRLYQHGILKHNV